MSQTTTPAAAAPKGKVVVRRLVMTVALMLLMLVPAIILMVITGQPAATDAALAAIIGMVAVMAAGVRMGVITTIVTALLAPLSIVAGVTPLTGAAFMALMTITVGRLSRFGLHRATMLVPIMLAWTILTPVPWIPRDKLDKLNALLADHGTSLSDALDTMGTSSSSGGSSSGDGPMSRIVGHALMEMRLDQTYLAWVMLFFFVGAIVPVIVLPLLTRKMPKPVLAPHSRHEAMPYTISITVLCAVGTYYFLDHPKQTGGSFFIATVLVLAQVGTEIQWRLTIERVLGTLAGVVLFVALATVFSGTTFVEVVGIPLPLTLYGIGVLTGAIAIMSKFGKVTWLYLLFMVPTTACLNAFTTNGAITLGEQRLGDNLVGAALVILAALITLGASRISERHHGSGGAPTDAAAAAA